MKPNIMQKQKPYIHIPFKGRLYIATNQLDSAKHYLSRSLLSENIYTKAGSLYRLAQIAEKAKQL